MEYEIHYYGEYEIKKVKYEVKHGRKLYIYMIQMEWKWTLKQLSYAEVKKHFCNTTVTRVLSSIVPPRSRNGFRTTVWQGAMVAMWYLWDGSGESSAEASAFTSYCVILCDTLEMSIVWLSDA